MRIFIHAAAGAAPSSFRGGRHLSRGSCHDSAFQMHSAMRVMRMAQQLFGVLLHLMSITA
jgi:hypothetical protein